MNPSNSGPATAHPAAPTRPSPRPALLVGLLFWGLCLLARPAQAQTLSLSVPPTLAVAEDSVALVPFTLNNVPPGAAPEVTASVPGDNPVVPTGNVTVRLEQNGAGFVELRPRPNAWGGVTLRLAAAVTGPAGLQRATASCVVTWTSVDDVPVLAPIPGQVTTEGAAPLLVPISFRDADVNPAAVFSVGSSRSNFVTGTVLEGTGTNRWLRLQPQPQVVGSGAITVTAATRAPATPTNSTSVAFMLTVLPRELAPSNNVASPSGTIATVADLNQDGWPDLVTGSNGRFLSLFRNLGRGFTPGQAALPPTVTQIAWADYDGDGDLDAFLAGTTRGQFWRNDTPTNTLPFGSILLRTVSNAALTNLALSAAWADFDNDGDLDLVGGGGAIQPGTAFPVWFARNDGQGQLVQLNGLLPNAQGALAVADFDGDGLPDVLLADAGQARNTAVVWRNEGGFRFAATALRVPVLQLGAAGTTDFDGDGWLDLWVQHDASTSPRPAKTTVLWRRTPLGFTEALRLPAEAVSQAGPPAWGDFDADGTPDFLASTISLQPTGISPLSPVTNHFALHRNDGHGRFTPGRFLFANVNGGSPAAGDFNRDGALDAWTPDNQGRVFYNQLRTANFPPDAPTGLFALASGTNVLFTWLPAWDANQTSPLTYNLRVGTRPGANDVIPSMSLADGTRLLPTPGNAGFATTRRLLLPDVDSSVLYWSVQAVDHSFAGSIWASEQALPVTLPPGQPPVITGLTNLVMDEDANRSVRFAVTDDRTRPEAVKVQLVPATSPLFAGIRLARFQNDLSGASTNYTLFFQPAPDASGEAAFAVIATDGGGRSATNRFTVTVRPVNDAPTITMEAEFRGVAGRPTPPIPFSLADVDNESLRVGYVQPEEPTSPVINVVFGGSGNSRTLLVTPQDSRSGSVPVMLLVTDGVGGETRQTITVHFADSAFQSVATLASDSEYNRHLWADLDADGTLELVVGSQGGSGLTIYRWQEGRFTAAGSFGSPAPVTQPLGTADLDHDGRMDLLVALHEAASAGPLLRLKFLRNQGNLQFGVITGPFTDNALGVTAYWAELDGDGFPDLLVEEYPGLTPSQFREWHNQDGTFAPTATRLNLGSSVCCLQFPDLNGDGTPEMIGRSGATGASLVFQRGAGGYVPLAGPWQPHWIQFLGDHDFDQLADLVALDAAGDLVVNRGLTTGFAAAKFLLRPPPQSPAALPPLGADFNQDGRLDFLFRDTFATHLWLATTNAGFITNQYQFAQTRMNEVALGDFDGDGALDFAANEGTSPSSRLTVYRGELLAANLPPTAPGNLHSSVSPTGGVQLSWSLATDPNQPGGLTYNLRVGTTPGGMEVWSPEARPDGRRLVPRNGNQGWRTNAVLRGLQPGRTYYWSVQAVDASFAGGPFAAEQSFTAPETAPSLAYTPADGTTSARLLIKGRAAVKVRLERSLDLRAWEDAGTRELGPDGGLEVPLPVGTDTGAIFYRAREAE